MTIDDLEIVERWTGRILSIGRSKSGAIRVTIRADDRGTPLMKRGRFFGHEKQWQGEVPADLKVGSRVSFLPDSPRKPGQYPRANCIRLEGLSTTPPAAQALREILGGAMGTLGGVNRSSEHAKSTEDFLINVLAFHKHAKRASDSVGIAKPH